MIALSGMVVVSWSGLLTVEDGSIGLRIYLYLFIINFSLTSTISWSTFRTDQCVKY